jgi:hypothetical protein
MSELHELSNLIASFKADFESKLEQNRADLEQSKAELKKDFDLKLEQNRAELEQSKAELKKDFDLKLEQNRAEFESRMQEVESFVDSLVDPRVKYWNANAESSTGSRDDIDAEKKHDKLLVKSFDRCMGCGRTELDRKLSVAHIICDVGSRRRLEVDYYELFGTVGGYRDDVNPARKENFLLLCGSQGQKGTCHDLYDTLQISLYWDSLSGTYRWFRSYLKFVGGCHPDDIATITWTTAQIGVKYRRLLAWRTLRTILQPGLSNFTSLSERAAFIDFLKSSEREEVNYG